MTSHRHVPNPLKPPTGLGRNNPRRTNYCKMSKIRKMFRGKPDLRVLVLMQEDKLREYKFHSRTGTREPEPGQLHLLEYAREQLRDLVEIQDLIIEQLKRQP